MDIGTAALRRGWIFLIAAIAALAAFAAVHGQAGAAPVCTINWTGGAGDLQWQTAGNWDTAQLPAAGDYACVPSASTDQISFTGTASVKGVSALGTKFTNNGNLSLTDPAQPSTIRNLRDALNKLSIAPGATLNLTGHPVLAGGSLGGGGTMIVPAGSNLAIIAHT